MIYTEILKENLLFHKLFSNNLHELTFALAIYHTSKEKALLVENKNRKEDNAHLLGNKFVSCNKDKCSGEEGCTDLTNMTLYLSHSHATR